MLEDRESDLLVGEGGVFIFDRSGEVDVDRCKSLIFSLNFLVLVTAEIIFSVRIGVLEVTDCYF